MLRSMTGFGSASSHEDGTSLQVEIRTVNNKFYKSNVRLPDALQSLEVEIDSVVSKHISRGSVTINVKFVDAPEHGVAQINAGILRNYIAQLREADDSVSIDASRLLSLPGVLKTDNDAEISVRVKETLLKLVLESCDKVLEMRGREGQTLEADLESQLVNIAEHLSHIKDRAPEIVSEYQARLRQRMESLFAEVGANVTEQDTLREVAIFAEKTDIAEEISRLDGHLEQFRELVSRPEDEPIGRTLDFLAQEMLRESNTIASKCVDGETSRRVVEIKGAVDRIKEQVQNAE
ncbi:MAG: YicC family protein [Phycisphaerae bacterium]|nr:YicC family protein [Phycisphaerae bacterium]|tara:strand:- start:6149 stop:7024 length:876 start_codon:yes stop_codon:yes gene_type:complete